MYIDFQFRTFIELILSKNGPILVISKCMLSDELVFCIQGEVFVFWGPVGKRRGTHITKSLSVMINNLAT